MTILNNVNVSALEKVITEAQTDKSKVKRTQKIEGEWRVEEGGPQFQAKVNFEGGKMIMASDQPTNLGGGGTLPGPLHYCFFGLLSCYTSTFAAMASMMGINLGIAAPMSFFPFGGAKGSFFGDIKGQGREAFQFFTDTKVVIQRWT